MPYRTSQEFIRIEAIGSRNEIQSDRADPVWLHVRVTPADDLSNEIESALMQGANPNGVNVTEQAKYPYRIATGIWGYDLDEQLYEYGKSYVIHWRFAMQPQVMSVVRSPFIWQPVPQVPRDSSNCILTGVMSRVGGIPMSGARIIIEQFKDFVTLTHRLGSFEVTTDAFGNWWVEVPRGSLQRVIFGEQIRTIKIPDVSRISLKDVVEYQPGDGRKDTFGYPYPDGVESSGGGVVPTVPGTPEPTVTTETGVLKAKNSTGQFLYAGSPIQRIADHDLVLAYAGSSSAVRPCQGIALNDTLPNGEVEYVFTGQVELADWTHITGAASLVPGADYYLGSAAGTLTRLLPSSPTFTLLQVVGHADDEHTLDVTPDVYEVAL